jgi:hypothetical protein
MATWISANVRTDIRQIVSDPGSATWSDANLNAYIKQAHAWVEVTRVRSTGTTSIALSSISAQFASARFAVNFTLPQPDPRVLDVSLLDGNNGNLVMTIPRAIRGDMGSGWFVERVSTTAGAIATWRLYVPVIYLESYKDTGFLFIRYTYGVRTVSTPAESSTVDDAYYWAVVYRASALALNRLFMDRVNFAQWLQANAVDSATPSDLLATVRVLNEEAQSYRSLYLASERR